MPVNSYDVSFLVALLMQGILLGVVDWYAIIWGSTKASVTFIHRAFVLYVLSIIMWTFWNIVNNFGFESLAPGTWGNYLFQTIAFLGDGFSNFGLGFAYIARINPLLKDKTWKMYSWVALIVPILYLGITCVSLALLYNPTLPIDPATLTTVFGAGNLGNSRMRINTTTTLLHYPFQANIMVAVNDILVHGFLVYLLLDIANKGQMRNQNVSNLQLTFPAISSVLYTCISIWSVLIPTIGTGPIYCFWTLEGFAFIFMGFRPGNKKGQRIVVDDSSSENKSPKATREKSSKAISPPSSPKGNMLSVDLGFDANYQESNNSKSGSRKPKPAVSEGGGGANDSQGAGLSE